ncbi:trypsin-like serine protease [Rhodococcus sp. UNC363MFTsu5.1]|uniref:trypsin-like serine protease n=1 Tax=Rhodococcus sp. UNC363MFTsu5.1 TaxID=1449069 RepID=UPI000A429617|nr:trypsin-like serine protease [Rhodococcus sp. UNC363MFTsu5.1]
MSTVVPCTGDSGGPLVIGTGPTARLAGIASYLDRRDNCDDPTVRLAAYTDAATIRDWAFAPDLVLAPAQTKAPRITGTPAVGSTVSCQSEWADPNAQLSVEWTIGDRSEDGGLTPVDGAAINHTARSIEIPQQADGHQLVCTVSARGEGGVSTGISEDVTVMPRPVAAGSWLTVAGIAGLAGAGVLAAVLSRR